MRHRIAVAIATITGSTIGANLAHAQSSVTLYGSVDAGLAYQLALADLERAIGASIK